MTQPHYKNFKEWIDVESYEKIAKRLAITSSTVRYWYLGKTCPRPALMHEIKKWTKGRITYAMMIEYHLASRNQK